MSDVISEPAPASTESPPAGPVKLAEESPTAGPVNLAELDDKHLSRYRHPNERAALVATFIGVVAFLIGLWLARPYLGNILDILPTPVLRSLGIWVDPTRLALLVLVALALAAVMDVVGQSTRAWQLVAQAVEVTPTTFPQLAPIVDELRTRFELPPTRVYVSRDAPPTGYTIGVRPPFAIVFSSVSVGQLTPDEFKFALGSEMGSIKLGHTVMASLLGNARMSLPQPYSFLLKFRSIIFGSYHHAQILSCDRIGVVATRNVTPAISMLMKQNLGQVRGAKIDLKSLTAQTTELQRGVSGAVFKMSMLLNAQPFALARLAELVTWAGEPVAAKSTAPAAPPPPTPAASAAAAAKSAAAAAESAKAAVAAVALLMPSGAGADVPPIAADSPAATEPSSAAAADGSSQASDVLSPGAEAAIPPAPSTASETSPVTKAVAAPALASESTGTGAPPPPAPLDGGVVSVTVPRPPQ